MITIIIVIIMIIMMIFSTLYCCQLFDFRILAGILVFGIIAALVATVAYIRFLSGSCMMIWVTMKASMIWSLTRFSGSFVFCSSVYQLYLLLRARRDRKTSQVRALQHIDACTMHCTSTKGTP